MKLNVAKFAVLRCTHSFISIQYTYILMGHNLEVKKLHTYHGLGIDNTISWSSHIQTISNRSNLNRSTKVLNFIERNLSNCPLDTKKTANLTLVRSIIEYAVPVLDSYYNTNINKLEKYKEELLNGFYLNT